VGASLTPKNGDQSDQYLVSVLLSRASRHYWFIRLLLLLVLFLTVTGTTIWEIWRRRIRNQRIRRKEIPYVAGQAISDPSKFFGRRDLITKIRNSIADNSYALIGEWRIGKSSIQYQLINILTSYDDPKYVFLPVFVDLTHLGTEKDDIFFHFLGEHLLEIAKKRKIPDNVIKHTMIYRCNSPQEYNSQRFEKDIQRLLNYWQNEFIPKKPIIIFHIDEFSIMETYHYDTLLAFRAVFVSEENAQVVLTGVGLPKDKIGDKLSPWSNFLKPPIEVLPLKHDEAKKIIEEPVHNLFSYDKEVIEEIIARAQGRPLQIQNICIDILNYKYNSLILKKRITIEDLKKSLKK